ncbi:3'(2'),5'-bisphosphate nucleotidase CysQ [Alteriqipengyuania lutimaris]|uniref:3'(2'),5'-bisphosphate nucleotidase CysQ n=1 Tax=Alteriqipengyuania lutimaris TaxID=1538146 RepID=A0A395LK93_9SPHN|nr:3'(2'),5'-bisphosphate nucleotidase CysQ [Alteriqipengyuania lutimaris]MBB3034330.1 3'(2'), 5'-bisphosphate nucleotidase [Alteriqipengyuania lutimaris]RDS76767.1 3'(2'),5'-bisphosphate nucleotidase CysQ [Alteriqipengyuania lutimaris]
MTDLELARTLAEQAGKIALAIRATGLIEGKALGKAGDRAANAFLVPAIAQHRPDDALLSEESEDDRSRLHKGRVWIVDPVDGTREYGEERADWAVHVGLAIDGVAHTGAVALPGLGLVLGSDAGARADHAPTGKIVVSRSRPPAEAERVAAALGMELVGMGSAGAKAMAVVRGDADAYLHSGGQYEWDNCAPVAVAQAHGLHCSRIDGAALRYNRADVSLPDLLICREELAKPILDAIAR